MLPPPIRVTFTVAREELSRRGKKGAAKLHATHDPSQLTEAARKAFRDKFERLADPHGVLDPQERAERAALLRREHYRNIGKLGAAARRNRREAGGGAE